MSTSETAATLQSTGRSEIMPGRVLLHFTDPLTKSDFTVPEKGSSTETIKAALIACRERHIAQTPTLVGTLS